MTAVADMVAQYLENELMINRRSPRRALQCDKGQNAVYIVLLVSCGVLGILDCRRKKVVVEE